MVLTHSRKSFLWHHTPRNPTRRSQQGKHQELKHYTTTVNLAFHKIMSSNYTCSAPIQVRPPFQQVTPPLNAIFKDSTAELPLSGQLMAVDCSTCFHCNHNAHCLPPQFYIIILLFPISPGYYSHPKRNPRQW